MQLLFTLFGQSYFPFLLIGLVGTSLALFLKRDNNKRNEKISSVGKSAQFTLWVCALLPLVFIATMLFILVTL